MGLKGPFRDPVRWVTGSERPVLFVPDKEIRAINPKSLRASNPLSNNLYHTVAKLIRRPVFKVKRYTFLFFSITAYDLEKRSNHFLLKVHVHHA
jgi:hypothetical protein